MWQEPLQLSPRSGGEPASSSCQGIQCAAALLGAAVSLEVGRQILGGPFSDRRTQELAHAHTITLLIILFVAAPPQSLSVMGNIVSKATPQP